MNDMTVSHEWSRRPNDERFLTLDNLFESVRNRADNTETFLMQNRQLKAFGT